MTTYIDVDEDEKMGSQTFEILRQGVWASLTGGWFYDPHQTVFCNVIHLYLWLFLLCGPFLTYLYFPTTFLTWAVYCVVTTFTVTILKVLNMGLHILYDKAQTVSDASFKLDSKSTKNAVSDECGIEMQVIGNDVPSRVSIDQPINEVSEGNSIMSLDNVTSTIDLKVDVHRKNSSESSESISMYPPRIYQNPEPNNNDSNNQQQTQDFFLANLKTSLNQLSDTATGGIGPALSSATTSTTTKSSIISQERELSRRYSENIQKPSEKPSTEISFKFNVPVFKDFPQDIATSGLVRKNPVRNRQHSRNYSQGQEFITDMWKTSQLNTTSQSPSGHGKAVSCSLYQINPVPEVIFDSSMKFPTENSIHGNYLQSSVPDSESLNKSEKFVDKIANNSQVCDTANSTDLNDTEDGARGITDTKNELGLDEKSQITSIQYEVKPNQKKTNRFAKLQRHHSTESHEENQRKNLRSNLFKSPSRPDNAGSSSSGGSNLPIVYNQNINPINCTLQMIRKNESSGQNSNLNFNNNNNNNIYNNNNDNNNSNNNNCNNTVNNNQHHRLANLRTLDMYLSNKSYTKSDLGIEQLEENSLMKNTCGGLNVTNGSSMVGVDIGNSSGGGGSCAGGDSNSIQHSLLSLLLRQTSSMRKDSNSTMSALQLPVAASIPNLDQQQIQNKRRHSSTSNKPGLNNNVGGSNIGVNSNISNQQSNVRRIKSTALEVACPQTSVSNLSPHPNSTEAIAGQQIKPTHPPLLPPPSKCLVRNQHLTFCTKLTPGKIGLSNVGFNMSDSVGGGDSDSIILPEFSESSVYSIAEHVAERNDENKPIKVASSPTLLPESIDDHEKHSFSDDNVTGTIKKQQSFDDHHKINSKTERNEPDISNRDESGNIIDDDDVNIVELKQCSNTRSESESDIDRPRTQSTDSETDNNGSRSPLLNKSDREIAKVFELQQSKSIQQQQPQSSVDKYSKNSKKNRCFILQDLNKGAGDSGCPSSDYEQASSSSKDMLLDNTGEKSYIKSLSENKIEKQQKKLYQNGGEVENEEKSNSFNENKKEYQQPQGLNIAQEEADIENLRLKDAKNLGAIPKIGIRRSSEIPIASGMGAPIGLTNMSAISTKRPVSKSMSRTSSSASSRSFSAESFSNDIYKTYRDRYSFILGEDVLQTGLGTLNPINVAGTTSGNNAFCRPFARRFNDSLGNFRLKHRLNIIDPDNFSNIPNLGNSSGVGRNNDILMEGRLVNSKLGEIFDLELDDLQKRHHETATLSIQGLMSDQYSFENSLASATLTGGGVSGGIVGIGDRSDRHHSSRHHSARQSSTGAILNEINDSMYCDYWRSCRLSTEKSIQPKKFYKYRWHFFGRHELKIAMDRLQLLALFDRDLHWFHVFLAIILSGLTCFLGAYILQLNLYKDIFAFAFCIVIAGSQYSLLKSVQPDAASPIHGFNKTVAYSRPVYFCLCSSLLIFSFQLNERLKESEKLFGLTGIGELVQPIRFFGIPFASKVLLENIIDFLSIILLLFPIFFSLGLFPQVNTFCMYLLEQIDMHVFGGNAVCSLVSSGVCVLKSLIAVAILYGPAFGGLTEEKGTQHFLFSFFCALLIPIAYHLSRSASDFSHVWILIKSGVASTIPVDDDDEEEEKILKKPQIKKSNSSGNNENEKLNGNVQGNDMSMKLTTSPSSDEMKMSNNNTEENTGDLVAANLSQQSKTICSTESKMDMSEDKTDFANPGEGENELSTETLDTNSILNGLEPEHTDPLPKKLQATVNSRLKNDLVVCTFLCLIVLGLHCTTVFTVLQPDLNTVLYIMAGILGFVLHYLLPQMRKHMPWLCFAGPILKQKEFGQFEVTNAAKIMWFEAIYVCFCFLERNILYPLIFISAATADSQHIIRKFGVSLGALFVSICALKCVRNAYSDPGNQYLILIFSALLFKLDFSYASETFLINYFFVSIFFKKSCDFLLKLQFIVTYIAPWQITWGSAFHAFAQPFSVPHSAMLFLQAAISAVLSTPLNPFLGSAIFLTSYVRPIKFWERDYNTRRIDHSNTRLSSQLERDLGADDNNLNSIFYEHLTRSLQHSLCGDLLLGRWGNVSQGDCFVLASDYLNCLVHIIELGNGLCTFQMRGLEFRGTYCQQREVEAISEGVEDNDACCCCNPGHIPKMLSANAMFSTRWLAWQVVAAQYVLQGYSISENLATATLQPFEFRKVLITYYIKSIIYYVTKNPKLDKWISPGSIQDSLAPTLNRQFVDLDPIFNYNLDEDFDFRALGITRSSFCSIYLTWIQLCYKKRKDSTDITSNLPSTADGISTDVSCDQKLTLTKTTEPIGNLKEEVDEKTYTDNRNSAQDKSQKRQLKSTGSFGNTKSAFSEDLKLHEDGAELSNMCSNTSVTEQPQSNDVLVGEKYCFTERTYSEDDNLEIEQQHSRQKQQQSEQQKTPPPRSSMKCRKKLTRRRLKFGTGTNASDLSKQQNDGNKSDGSNAAAGGASAASDTNNGITKDSPLVSLCLALGLLARRSLATASHSSLSGVEFFLHGLHALFKGDFRITSPRDEWVFADMELLHGVVAPAVKMALKLHQDHFSSPDEYLDPTILYEAMSSHMKELVISHEADPVWRSAVLRGAPNLLALRHVMEDGSDEYRIIRLTKRFLSFRVIKLNRECVRGLWAGQQQELIYLRNRNPERGSIQNAKQALRNIINSSCDQPIGYPIYVSPLTTSYADTNEQICQVVGGPITFESIKGMVLESWRRIRERCREGCSSGSGGLDCEGLSGVNEPPAVYFSPSTAPGNTQGTLTYGSQNLSGTGTRGSLASMNKPNSSTLLTTFLKRDVDQEKQETSREGKSNTVGGGGNRKHYHNRTSGNLTGSTKERDRRATLPIASTTTLSSSSRDFMVKDSGGESSQSVGLNKYDSPDPVVVSNSKISNPSGNLEDYDNKTSSAGGLDSFKSAEFSTVEDLNRMGPLNEYDIDTDQYNSEVQTMMKDDSFCRVHIFKDHSNHPLIELNRKAIIINGLEIYDYLDSGRRIDVVWPNEKMRCNGGRSTWQDWSPQEGMVGYVRHYWQPNHPDARFRSNVNATLYLIEINDHYVPVGECGVREYNQINSVDQSSMTINTLTSTPPPTSSQSQPQFPSTSNQNISENQVLQTTSISEGEILSNKIDEKTTHTLSTNNMTDNFNVTLPTTTDILSNKESNQSLSSISSDAATSEGFSSANAENLQNNAKLIISTKTAISLTDDKNVEENNVSASTKTVDNSQVPIERIFQRPIDQIKNFHNLLKAKKAAAASNDSTSSDEEDDDEEEDDDDDDDDDDDEDDEKHFEYEI